MALPSSSFKILSKQIFIEAKSYISLTFSSYEEYYFLSTSEYAIEFLESTTKSELIES